MVDIFTSILQASLFAGLMIIIVFILKAIFDGRIKTKLIGLLWAVVLIRLLLPVTINLPIRLNEIDFSIKQSVQENIETQQADLSFLDNVVNTVERTPFEEIGFVNQEENGGVQTTVSEAEQIETSFFDYAFDWIKSLSILHYCFALWLMGAVALMIFITIKSIKFRKMIKYTSVNAPKSVEAIIKKHKVSLGIKQEVSIVFSKLVSAPITFGAVKPVIIMPYGFAKAFSKEKLNLMILHEMCHIKRKDIAVNICWMIAKIIHWFNPLVWIAYKEYVQDMELACDEMVVSNLSTKQSFVYSQSLIDVIRFSKKETKLPFVLSFCEDKTKLRRRVENMLKPKNKLTIASVVCVLFILVMTITGFTTACMPSKETDSKQVVVEKAVEIRTTETGESSIEPQEETISQVLLKEKLNIPDRLENKLLFPDDNLEIYINADITVPEKGDIPIVNVKAGNFSQQAVDGIIDMLFKDEAIYEVQRGDKTKSEIKDEIRHYKRDLEDDDLDEESKDDARYLISELEKQYDTAPTENQTVVVESDGQIKIIDEINFKTNEKIGKTGELNITTNADDFEHSQTVSITNMQFFDNDESIAVNYNWNSHLWYIDYRVDGSGYYESGSPPIRAYDGMELNEDFKDSLTFTPSEAIEFCEGSFEKAGLSDFKVHDIFLMDNKQNGNTDGIFADADRYYYEVRMHRQVDEIPCSFYQGMSHVDHGLMWEYEWIQLKVLGDKIIDLNWHSPLDIGAIESQNAELIPYKDIIDKAEQGLKDMFISFAEGSDIKSVTVSIDRINLEYHRVATDDEDAYSGILIPVWNFYGDVDVDYKGTDFKSHNLPSILLGYNAIDGSRVVSFIGS